MAVLERLRQVDDVVRTLANLSDMDLETLRERLAIAGVDRRVAEALGFDPYDDGDWDEE